MMIQEERQQGDVKYTQGREAQTSPTTSFSSSGGTPRCSQARWEMRSLQCVLLKMKFQFYSAVSESLSVRRHSSWNHWDAGDQTTGLPPITTVRLTGPMRCFLCVADPQKARSTFVFGLRPTGPHRLRPSYQALFLRPLSPGLVPGGPGNPILSKVNWLLVLLFIRVV